MSAVMRERERKGEERGVVRGGCKKGEVSGGKGRGGDVR